MPQPMQDTRVATRAALFAIALCHGVGCAESAPPAREDGGSQLPDGAMGEGGTIADGGVIVDGAAGLDAATGDGGRGDGGGGGSCEPPELHREPGEAVTDLDQHGGGPCVDTALRSAIDAVHAAHPELDDIRVLFVPNSDRIGDQSYIYAFATRDGGFALVFRRGGGDCPAGCTENDYYYFRTDERCEPQAVGSFVPRYDAAGCIAVEGFPLWDHPPPPDPLQVCGAPNTPQPPSARGRAPACGQSMPCSSRGGPAAPITALDFELRYTLVPTPDPARSTLTLLNTGHAALDGRPFEATLERGRVHVFEQIDNLPAVCAEQEEIEVLLDFEGYSDSFVHYFEARTPDCENASGEICKGGLDLMLGNLAANACIPYLDLTRLVAREQAQHAECVNSSDCALVAIDSSCVSNCSVAVSADYAETLEALVAQAGAAYCADADCTVTSDCAALEAACDEGRCTARSTP